MKVKALLAAALLACGSLTASAQRAGDFRFGITAGMNVATITDYKADSRIGFHAGVQGEYYFTKNVYGGFGLLFTQKGCKFDDFDQDDYFEYTANPTYIEIPLQIGYHYNLGNGVALFGETGPYLAFGVCGKEKVDFEGWGDDVKVDFFSDRDGAKTFDGGWRLRAGLEVSKLQISLGYEHGFSKVWDEGSCHNSNFMVGLSYMF